MLSYVEAVICSFFLLAAWKEAVANQQNCRTTRGRTTSDVALAAPCVQVELPQCFIDFFNRPTIIITQPGPGSFTLSCGVSNARKTDWYKEDTLIQNRPGKYRLMGRGRLMVQDICLGDMGRYRCVAHRDGDTCRWERHTILEVRHECGQPVIAQPARRELIAGGTIAAVGSAPWMAQLVNAGTGWVFCGGTLIARRWILTAAHCIRGKTSRHFQIKLGKHSRRAIIEDHERIYTVARIFSHERYNDVTFDNDIALLQLDTDVEYNDYIKPICLAPADFHHRHFFNDPTSSGIVTGWGRLAGRGPFPGNLQEIQLPLQNRFTCDRSTAHTFTDNMFCAGFAQPIIGSACKGDSGGPFIMENSGKWYQVGIVSWGRIQCARPGQYSFYTKLANFYSWIIGKIGENCA